LRLNDWQDAIVCKISKVVTYAYLEWMAVLDSLRTMSGESCMPHGITFWILATHFEESLDGCISVHGAFYMDTILARNYDSEAEAMRIVESRVFQLLS
jgi:hypothetical protein